MNASYKYKLEYNAIAPSGQLQVSIYDDTKRKMAEFHTELELMTDFIEKMEDPDARIWGNMPNTTDGYFGYNVNKDTNTVTFVCNFGNFTLEIIVLINEELGHFISQLKEHKKILEQKEYDDNDLSVLLY